MKSEKTKEKPGRGERRGCHGERRGCLCKKRHLGVKISQHELISHNSTVNSGAKTTQTHQIPLVYQKLCRPRRKNS
ncbi:MAG: hypothetical protein IJH22_02915, partial [Firmicutes bacterium]|nr:hypothetical protein [Bacillota bacterium]